MPNLDVATTPLDEAITPTAVNMTVATVEATVAEYGSWMQYSDKFLRTAVDNMKTAYTDALGRQAGDTIDQLIRDVAAAQTTNVIYPSGSSDVRTGITAAMTLTAPLVRKAIRALHSANALPIEGDRFIGILSESTWYDFVQDSTIYNIMEQVYDRGQGNPLISGYMGTALNTDWYMTTNAKTYDSTVTVHATMIFGKDAIGFGGLAGMMPSAIKASQFEPNTGKRIMPVTIYDTTPETDSKEDPLHQRGTLGWRTTFVAKLLNGAFTAKIEHGVTA